jgi:hypothetical protein
MENSNNERTEKCKKIEELNRDLNPLPEDLPGRFLPEGYPEQFDFMFLAPRPSMNVPRGWDGNKNYNFDVTSKDKFFQRILVECGVAGSYVTDIVKKRAEPGEKITSSEINEYLPFLLEEIDIIDPKFIILIGNTAEKTFDEEIAHYIPKHIKITTVWHYSQQGAKTNEEIVRRFQEVISNFNCFKK